LGLGKNSERKEASNVTSRRIARGSTIITTGKGFNVQTY